MTINTSGMNSANSLIKGMVVGLLFLASFASNAQLPELATPAAASGAATTAKFFGGATADGGASYKTSFGFSEPLSIDTAIQVESAHVNTVGNLYIVIALGETYFVRDETGNYVPLDLTAPNLLAASPAKTLQSNEPLSIISNVAFGPAGVSGTSLSIFLAYDTIAAPDELYYSGVPLTFAIEQEVTTPSSLTLFTNNVSSQIIQSLCIACHTTTGIASATSNPSSRLQYLTSSQNGFLNTNYNTLVNFIKNVQGGSTLILAKPQGQQGHVGGQQLSPSSPNFLKLQEFVNAVLSE